MESSHTPDAPAAMGENSITAKMRRVRPPAAPVRAVETINVTRYREAIRPSAPAGQFPQGDASKLKLVPQPTETPAR